MVATLTASKIKDTYGQVLHVDGGITSTSKTVYDGDGTASAVKIATTHLEVDNIKLDGSTISTLDGGILNLVNAAVRSGTIYPDKVGYDEGVARTQLTSRTTGVTADFICGTITLVAGTISAHTGDVFRLSNNLIAANDIVLLSFKSGLTTAAKPHYTLQVVETGVGYCDIAVCNKSASTIPAAGSDTPVINFAVVKSHQSTAAEA